MKRRNRKTSPPKNLPSGKSSARTCIWKRELSKKPPLFLTRRFAPRAKNTPQTRQVLFGLHCTTKLEPLSSRRATDFARSACVVASDFIVRSDSVVTLNITPHASQSLGVPPSPFAPSPFLFFSRGEINWNGVAKRRGGAARVNKEAGGTEGK